MIRFLLALLAAILVSTSPALAGKKDDAWAQCLWEKAPLSAANWLAMPIAERWPGPNGASPAALLEFRLRAACHTQLTPPGKRYPPSLMAKAVRASLERIRPSVVGTNEIDPRAYQCTRYFLNDTELKTPAAYAWGFGDFDSGTKFSSMSFTFAAKGGGGVGLPETGGLRKCQVIKSDGSLADA
jgi:hypothetical protein